jgi:hypothetical protein
MPATFRGAPITAEDGAEFRIIQVEPEAVATHSNVSLYQRVCAGYFRIRLSSLVKTSRGTYAFSDATRTSRDFMYLRITTCHGEKSPCRSSANYVERSNQSMEPTAIWRYISFVMTSFPYSAVTHPVTRGSSSCSRWAATSTISSFIS